MRIPLEIDVLVLDGAPEPLDEDVVEGAPTTIHADTNMGGFQLVGEGVRGELHALVGIEDVRLSHLQGEAQGVQTEPTVERVGQAAR